MIIRMERKSSAAILLLFMVFLMADLSWASKKRKICDKVGNARGSSAETTPSRICSKSTISRIFSPRGAHQLPTPLDFGTTSRSSPPAALFEPIGFETTGGKQMQMKYIAAFLGHVGSQISCGYNVATGGPYAWGLCYNREMSPSQSYCNPNYLYPCTPGVAYYGRGAIPVY